MNRTQALVTATLITIVSLMLLPLASASASTGLSLSDTVWDRCRTQPITWTMYSEGSNLNPSVERKLMESAFQQIASASGGVYTFAFVKADTRALRDATRSGANAPADTLIAIASDAFLSVPLGKEIGSFRVNTETPSGSTEPKLTSAFFSYNPHALSSYTAQQRTAIYTSGALMLVGVTRYEYSASLTSAERKAVKTQARRSCSRSA